nr:DNA-directed DNA polymerase [Tanacetum cinerariifolium]
MADNQTMAELLQAPTEGYEDAIVILEIAANNFELQHGLINLVQNKQIFGHDKEDPHAHIRYFNKITSTMRQRFDESFYEAWDRFNDLLRACPHHGFSELHQLDTFYNALNVNDQDSLNSAASGNFLDKMPRECLKIIECKSKVRQSQANAVVPKVSTSSSTPAISSDVFELKDMVRALLLDKKNQSSAPAPSSTPAPVKAIEPNCVTCGGTHSYQNCPATSENVYRDNIQEPTSLIPGLSSSSLPSSYSSDTSVTRTDFESYIKANDAILRNIQCESQNVQNQCQGLQTQIANLTDMLSKFVSSNTASSSGSRTLPSNTITNPKEDLKGITTRSGVAYQGPPIPTPVPMPNLKPSIPYPLRRDNERRHDQANEQIKKFYQIFKDMSFQSSFTDALILMPKFAFTLKALIGNKEKLSEMARTPMNEHCLAVILNKLPRKFKDPGKYLIPCEFPGMDECLALADLGASINLMPLSVWEGLSLPELNPTCMNLELADHLVSKPIGIAKDVSVKVRVFHFPADFVVVYFEPDLRVPLILGRCFLKTGRALIDVHKGELTLRIGNKAITYNLDQTVRYSANYNQMTANKIDVIFEMYSQEVLGFSDVTTSGNPTPYDDPIVSTMSLTLTPFGDSDFLLFEEADAFLAKTVKSSVDEPPEVELKDLPPHLEYAFLEGDNKLLVIIAKELGDEDKSALIKVLKSHKRAIAWKLSNIQGINPEFCTHKILMEENYKPAVQHERRVNPKIHDVIKKEVEKLLDAGLIYPISDSPWVSPVHCVPKKGGFTVVENEENELIPTRLVTRWRRLAGNEYYCFLDGFSGYFHIPIDPRNQEKTTFTCLYGTFAYRRMPFGLCNAPGTFQRCILAIFHDMVEKTMEVFMDDLSVFENSFNNCLSRLDKMLERLFKLPRGNFIVKGENRASWSDKLDVALWAFRTAYKTPIGCTPYKLVYGKACHLPIELEHKAYLALKQANFDLTVMGNHRKVQLNELNELRDHAYENLLIYKEKTKRIHDSKIKNRVFNVGDRVLLFNSRLKIFSGKLKTHWSVPFTITKVFPYGTVELSQANGPNFKVNGHRVKHYFGRDVPQLVVSDLQTFPIDN